jgi:2,3-bisphosphoglycerate-independent phosphoglycerate mutase
MKNSNLSQEVGQPTGNGPAEPKILFLFLDGVGLGPDDPANNPFSVANMPNLTALLDGRRLTSETGSLETDRASLLALDATLGVSGAPQSATGQAVLLTGRNIPAELGYHYGPKPNPDVAAYLRNGNLFHTLITAGRQVSFLDAYPPGYFAGIESGRRLYSAIPLASVSAGLPLLTGADLDAGRALAADFTGEGWRDRLHLPQTPVLSPEEAGHRLAHLAMQNDFAFFEYWLTDYAGHHQDMAAALELLSTLDAVLGGLLAAWDDAAGLILVTSDHGNMEDLSVRGHTLNPVPALVIGAPELRRRFTAGLAGLTDVAPAIERLLA